MGRKGRYGQRYGRGCFRPQTEDEQVVPFHASPSKRLSAMVVSRRGKDLDKGVVDENGVTRRLYVNGKLQE